MQLKQEVAAISRGRGHKYPRALEARIIAYARSRRGEGATWEVISGEIGVPVETVRRKSVRVGERASELVPVRVVSEPLPERVVSLVSPSGFRIDGLALSEAVAALRALS